MEKNFIIFFFLAIASLNILASTIAFYKNYFSAGILFFGFAALSVYIATKINKKY